MLKRSIDIFLSLTGLILALPVMLIIAFAIRLETPGSVFFSQTRLGLKGKKFKVHKFRKFPIDWGTFGSNVTLAGDVRRTAVGSFIERTKLDELPQLWNILKGEMSCVGPRPESLAYADLFTGKYEELLDYKPGIFGPNQVEFRNESSLYPPDQDPDEFYRNVLFPKKAKNDIAYFSKSDCIGELLLVVRGIWVSLIGVVDWQNWFTTYRKIVLADILAIEFSWLLTHFLRFGFSIKGHDLEGMLIGMVLFPIFTFSAMILAGVYRTPVRYFSGNDASRLVITVSTAWMTTSFFILGFIRRDISIALPPISLLIALSIMSIIRIWYRERKMQHIKSSFPGDQINILVYGAGYRGATMASLIEQGFPSSSLVGLIDDRLNLKGRKIGKYKILGSEQDLDALLKKHKFQQLWMSFSPAKKNLRQITDWCEYHNVKLVILPNIEAFSNLNKDPFRKHSNTFTPPKNPLKIISINDRRRKGVANKAVSTLHKITIQEKRRDKMNSSKKTTIPDRRSKR